MVSYSPFSKSRYTLEVSISSLPPSGHRVARIHNEIHITGSICFGPGFYVPIPDRIGTRSMCDPIQPLQHFFPYPHRRFRAQKRSAVKTCCRMKGAIVSQRRGALPPWDFLALLRSGSPMRHAQLDIFVYSMMTPKRCVNS